MQIYSEIMINTLRRLDREDIQNDREETNTDDNE